MAKLILVVSNVLLPMILLISLRSTQSSLQDAFIFNGFKQAAPNMTLDGHALITSTGLLELTNTSADIMGHAFFSSPFQFFTNHSNHPNSFSTHFVFSIVPPAAGVGGGHGLTFVVSPSKILPRARDGPFLGLLNTSGPGDPSNHLLAVEFDTSKSFRETNDNHVGIDINSLNSTTSEAASYYTNARNKEAIQLESGTRIQAWVEYDGLVKDLKVTISPSLHVPKPKKPLLTQRIDVSTILEEFMYVGFTASTGKAASTHCILGWSFKMNGMAPTLDLSALPPPPHIRGVVASGLKTREIIVIVGISCVVTLALLGLVIFGHMYINNRTELRDIVEDWEVGYPHRFKYRDIHAATRGFKESEILGAGGFGCVYKGTMPSTKEEVAIKKISHNSNQGVREFVSEIASLGRLRHRHLVHLLGWCKWRGDLLIVYEYMPNGSLADFLYGKSCHRVLTWEERFKILKGIASALLYLHEEWEQVVIHRDVKSSNVLLDGFMNARLGDFGLARLYDHGSNPLTTRVVGTLGYMAPEITRTGKGTPSSDVFGYGTLLLEVACGRMPIDVNATEPEKVVLLDWLQKSCECGRILDAIDLKLRHKYVSEEAELVLKLGLICCQSQPEARPSMRQVTQYLEGHDSLPVVEQPSFASVDFGSSYVATSSNTLSIGVISSTSLGTGR